MKKIGIFNFRVTDRVQKDMARSTRLVIPTWPAKIGLELDRHGRSTRLVILVKNVICFMGSESPSFCLLHTLRRTLLLYE